MMIGLLLWTLLASGEPAPSELPQPMAAGAVEKAAEEPKPTAEQLQFFENRVRPILVEHCQKCHGEKKSQASLRLDSREGVMRGGDQGPVIIAGKPAESELIRAVRYEDADLKMPPEAKLKDEQIADLTKWVEMGAPFPATAKSNPRTRDPNHWSFQPPANVAVPTVKDAAWARSPIDNFILSKLEANGQVPTAQADKRTLLRRATFDLTGLPPTPQEVADFLADEQPNAFARVVERLLASPAYGERWGRHWLDVARYADSNGLDENVAFGTAWRYRDYVVEAFNKDKPYDQFLAEQLAGDLLKATDDNQRHEQLIATGFLALGPKVLAEVDEAKMHMDIVDEQIDTFGRAVLGLTLGCARCHDHKFDPIQAADYYGFAGIFKSTRAMENYKKLARWYENRLESPAALAAEAGQAALVASKKQAVDALVAKADETAKQTLPADSKPPEKLESLYPDETKMELKRLRDELAKVQATAPEFPTAIGVTEAEVADEAIRLRGNPLKLGDVVPRHVPPVVKGPETPQFTAKESGRRELVAWLTDPRHPLTSRVMVNRVWRWHFGKGLVRTTDNFGLLGEAPSHPELLDWLARRFVADDWSLKSLHRLIMNSSVYQQGSQATPGLVAQDPENRWFGRADVRRMEAEVIRDTMLAVAGALDRTMGGTILAVKNRGYLFDHTSKDLTDYNSNRRSLYLPVIRNNRYDVFQLLDAPDATIPSGDRTTTTVASQALLMLNSDLVMKAAAGLAERLLSGSQTDAERMQQLYAIAYGRNASPEEVEANLAFLAGLEKSLTMREPDAAARQRQAWSVLSHVVLAANEFVYVK